LILPVQIHKDFLTAELASRVQGLLRHNHGRPYMCKPCSTLEVIATGPNAACGMAGKDTKPTSRMTHIQHVPPQRHICMYTKSQTTNRQPEMHELSLLATALIQAATAEQSLFALTQAQPSCVVPNVSSTPKCYGTSGHPSAPGMFGGQQHGASLCTGCRYKKRYQEWACTAWGATGMLCCHQAQQDTSRLSCAQAVIELPHTMLFLHGSFATKL